MHAPPRFVGRYKVLRELGRGAMGIVYLAEDPVIRREVALKVLWPTADPSEGERLAAEARVSGRLVHPNIVTVFDAGEVDGQPFIVMQYVQGRTLGKVLSAPERPSLALKLRWMRELCDGLQHAHDQRVIHRDIKPTNLLVDAHSTLRILDFGVAKILSTSQINFTSVGTPAYMAPEQYSRAPVDSRTDVFAAGLVLFEMITHTRALIGDSPAQILGQLMLGPMPRLADVAPDVDPELAAIFERATARDPSDRFQTAGSLSAAITAASARLAGLAAVVPVGPAPPLPPELTSSTVLGGASPRPEPPSPPAVGAPPASGGPLGSGSGAGSATSGRIARTRSGWLPAAVAVLAILGTLGAAWQIYSRYAVPEAGSASGPAAPGGGKDAARRNTSSNKGVAGPPGAGLLTVSSDVADTSFSARGPDGGAPDALSAGQPNPLPPGRYEIRADFVDRDPLFADASGGPISAQRTVSVAAGEASSVRFALEPVLWRHRFERALARPASRKQAAALERTYRRLKELGLASASDDMRYARTGGEPSSASADRLATRTDGPTPRGDVTAQHSGMTGPAVPAETVVTQSTPALLKNADVVAMTKSGQPDAVLVAIVRRSKSEFDTSPAGLIGLQREGVSKAVIEAMLTADAERRRASGSGQPQKGSIRVRGPVASEVFLNGAHRGAIAATGEWIQADVAPGANELRLVTPDRHEIRNSVTVVSGQEALVSMSGAAAPREVATATPAPTSTAGRTFNIPSAMGSRSLHISRTEVRYERRDSRGKLAPESFTLPCDQVSLREGKFGLSLQISLKDGMTRNVDVRNRLLEEILSEFTETCGRR